MDTKIGNYYIWCIVFFGFYEVLVGAQHLELRVVNRSNDTSVTTLSLGVPYTLEIKAEGAQDLYKCTIPGLENFHSEFCGASHLDLMSHITTVHSYVIRADKLGDFTLGPISLVTKNGTILTSNSLTLNVIEQEQSDIIVELDFQKKSVVAGQRIDGVIRISNCINAQLLNLQIPTLDAELGSFVQLPNPTQSKRVIDGKNYVTVEIPVTVLLKKPGRYSLPKICALCRVPSQKQQRFWGFGFSMHGSQDQWFYSKDPVKIEVAALPPKPVNTHLLGIGLFDSVTLQCKQKKATRGEGIVTILDIIGKEGLDDVMPPPLELPAGLKYYESKTSLEKLTNGLYKKSCEYIIQATEDRTFEIPVQSYSYFDTNLHSYKQLKTNAIHLEISGGKDLYKEPDEHNNKEVMPEQVNEEKIRALKSNGPWSYTPERSLSFQWFLACISIILISCLASGIRRYRQTLGPDYWLAKKRKNAFKFTRNKLAQLKKNNNYIQLYDIFNQLFKDRCQLSPSEVTAQNIEDHLKKAGFFGDSLEQWNRFFLQLSELAYFQQSNKRVPDDLFNRALMWINQLEEKL